MALPLNVFRTVTRIATTNPVEIYTAPTGYSSVVLLAQAANISVDTKTISLSHKRTRAGIAVTTEIVQNLPLPGNDSISLLYGKLVLESGDSLVLSANDTTNVKFIGSILETLN
jgi:hypothetical protein